MARAALSAWLVGREVGVSLRAEFACAFDFVSCDIYMPSVMTHESCACGSNMCAVRGPAALCLRVPRPDALRAGCRRPRRESRWTMPRPPPPSPVPPSRRARGTGHGRHAQRNMDMASFILFQVSLCNVTLMRVLLLDFGWTRTAKKTEWGDRFKNKIQDLTNERHISRNSYAPK